MAIAPDNSSGPHVSNPVTSQTTPFTVGSGSNRFMYVWVLGDTAATTGISGITYAGVAMTKLTTHRVSTDRSFDVYYLVNPASGSNNVVISRGVSGVIASGFVSYSGVNQSAPIPTSTTSTDTNSNTSYSGSITTTVDNSWAIVGIRDASGATITAGSGLTVRVTNTSNGIHLGDSDGPISPAGSHTFNATWNSAVTDGAILFELAAAGAAPAAGNAMFMGANF